MKMAALPAAHRIFWIFDFRILSRLSSTTHAYNSYCISSFPQASASEDQHQDADQKLHRQHAYACKQKLDRAKQ